MERLSVVLRLVAGQYKTEARAAASETGKITKAQAEAGAESKKWAQGWKNLGGVVKGFLAIQAGRKIIEWGRQSIQAASDLDESINAVEKTFGEASKTITDFGNIAASAAGLSKREFHDLATVTGSLLTNMGFGMQSAAQETVRLTQRAADMASVFNVDVSEVLTAINAGLRGETEPLRRFGVMLSDAAVRAKAVEMGLAGSTKEVDLNAKAQASLALIMEQSDKTAGDFVQTTDSLANAQKRAAAQAENAQARFGASLARWSAGLVSFAATALDSFGALSGDEVAKANLRMQEAIDNINEAARAGQDPLSALADSLLHLARNGELTSSQFEALATAAGLPIEKYGDFRDIVLEQAEAMGLSNELIDEMKGAFDGAASSASDMGAASEELTEELVDQADATDKAREAALKLRLEQLAAADPIFAAVSAIQRYEDAQAALEEVQKDRKATDEDLARATLDVAEAAIEVQGASDKLRSGDIDAGIRLLADAANMADSDVRALLETLGLLDGKTVVSTVRVRMIGDPGAPIPRSPGGGNVARATGGPVSRHQMYRGGEGNRPEVLFIPGDHGRVFSNNESRALIAALSGGVGGRSSQVTINLESTGNPDTDAQLVGATVTQVRLAEAS